MKSFNEWINESNKIDMSGVAWRSSVIDLIFIKKGNWIPIFPSMMKKLSKPIKCFHITNPNNLTNLIALQHSRKSISCSTTLDDHLINWGTGPNAYFDDSSGIIVCLSGNLLVGGNKDIMSVPDTNGNRWLEAKNFKHIPTANKLDHAPEFLGYLANLRIENLKRKLILKYNPPIFRAIPRYDPDFSGVANWIDIPSFVNKETMNKIINDYIEESKKIWEEIASYINNEHLFDLKLSSDRESTEYNEVLVNNIKIIKVLISKDPKGIAESACKKNGIDYILVDKRKGVKKEILDLMT